MAGLEETDAAIAKVASADDPHVAAYEVLNSAWEPSKTSILGDDLYTLWLDFTEWCEEENGSTAEKGDALRRAAREWGVIRYNESAHARYFAYWEYEVIGAWRPWRRRLRRIIRPWLWRSVL